MKIKKNFMKSRRLSRRYGADGTAAQNCPISGVTRGFGVGRAKGFLGVHQKSFTNFLPLLQNSYGGGATREGTGVIWGRHNPPHAPSYLRHLSAPTDVPEMHRKSMNQIANDTSVCRRGRTEGRTGMRP